MNDKHIGVIIDFLTPAYEERITQAAAKHGYSVRYFSSSAANSDRSLILTAPTFVISSIFSCV